MSPLPQIDRAGRRRLRPRSGEQLAGQPLAALGGAGNRCGTPVRRFVRGIVAQQLGIAAHHRQQVVEVVGDPAGELADRLHPLSLPQGGLGLAALLDLDLKALVDRSQIAGAALDHLLDPACMAGPEHQENSEQPGA